ncbi:MAG: zinc metalloprotease HtpX [Phycisphaerae bacterium]|nr:zinc metalloprotease HtpX [Phycisphaerae bacterium]
MYRFINNIKTAFLLSGLWMLFVFAGRAIAGQTGMYVALVLGGMTSVFAFFFSAKLALASMRAQPVDPRQAPELYEMVEELAQKANIPTPKIYICPQQAPNAFATGRSPRNAAVCVTQGLMQMLNHNELKAVIAHELAHIKHRDILIASIAAVIAGGISALGYMFYFMPLGGDDDDGNPLAAIALMILAPIAAVLIQMAISRRREFNADNYGAELVGNPKYLADALTRLHNSASRIPMHLAMESQKALFIVKPFTGKKAKDLFSSHPSLEDRIAALMNN